MPVNPDRLIGDLRALARIGQFKTGVHRPAFSADDMAARAWLRDKMQEAGLDTQIDGIGNVYGRMTKAKRAVLIGSHSDTVPYGGWLDGALGVIYALEIARCVAENGQGDVGVDAVSFQDEEGTFLGLIGSRVFCAEKADAEIAAAKDTEGKPLTAAIDEAKLKGRPLAHLDRARHIAFMEAHIEQGPRLEASGDKIGVVGAIVGIRTFRIVFHGQANHAGTTPMSMRHDAGAAAMKLGADLQARMRAGGSAETVWNIGSAKFSPGAANVVPAEAELFLQFRDTSATVMENLEQIVRTTAQEAADTFQVTVEVTPVMTTAPALMNPALAGLIQSAADELKIPSMKLPSGAGHDAMILSRYVPSAMLFVPSIGGRSHHISENTSDADIVLGAQVMLRAVEMLIADPTVLGG